MNSEILSTVDTIAADKKFAVGNDLVFIPSFKTSLTNLFKQKVYTPGETAYCDLFDDALLRYASTWAAKEAVYKALKQLDPSPISWKRVEIIREKPAGKPNVIFHQNPDKFQISLSISHDGDYVWAVAFIQIAE
ncbi:MAG TPA: holo-ACP synthase [Mucilaginibacter sp.]|jgi:holo-[acyl-carrier protein] synthase|nr:holo-ACP synthase [Mucilaginibacter sp.]